MRQTVNCYVSTLKSMPWSTSFSMQIYFQKFMCAIIILAYIISPFLSTIIMSGSEITKTRKSQVDSNSSSSSNSKAVAAAAGKKPEVYEQRSHVNKFEQRPEEIKFQSSMVVVKPKKVSGSTKAQMDTRIAKKKTKKSITGIKISWK